MRSSLSTVIFGGNSSGSDQHISYADFASAVGLSVISGETFYQNTCKFIFSI